MLAAMRSGPPPEPVVTSTGSSLARKGSNCHSENRRVQLSASASVQPREGLVPMPRGCQGFPCPPRWCPGCEGMRAREVQSGGYGEGSPAS